MPRRPSDDPVPYPRLRRALRVAVLVVSLAALAVVGLAGVTWLTAQAGPPARLSGVWLLEDLGLMGILVFFLGMLVGAVAVLAAVRVFEVRVRREWRERLGERRRQAARQAQASLAAQGVRAPPPPAGGVEAILVVDIVQSTELITRHGDAFFRDLLRRIEVAFIPAARTHRTKCVDGYGDALLFCFDQVAQAHAALREMFAHIPALNRAMPAGTEVAFRASLHVGDTLTDSRGNRTGLAVLKALRLGSVMQTLYGRGAGQNSAVLSAEAARALADAGVAVKPLGEVEIRGFPGVHRVFQLEG